MGPEQWETKRHDVLRLNAFLEWEGKATPLPTRRLTESIAFASIILKRCRVSCRRVRPNNLRRRDLSTLDISRLPWRRAGFCQRFCSEPCHFTKGSCQSSVSRDLITNRRHVPFRNLIAFHRFCFCCLLMYGLTTGLLLKVSQRDQTGENKATKNSIKRTMWVSFYNSFYWKVSIIIYQF